MKTVYFLPTILIPATILFVTGCASHSTEGGAPAPVVQTVTAPAPQASNNGPAYHYEQRAYAASDQALVPQERGKEIMEAFVPAYEKLSKPRLLIYVNRDLVTAAASLRASDIDAPSKNSTTQSTTPITRSAPELSLADKQTTRDIERLVGKPFRYVGAPITDQKTAASLISEIELDTTNRTSLIYALRNDATRKDREALLKITDVVIEVLVSTRTVNIAQVSGDRTVTLPDIQMTAIRLSDSAIIGQATASDILNRMPPANAVTVNINDLVEATTFNLMSDMIATAK